MVGSSSTRFYHTLPPSVRMWSALQLGGTTLWYGSVVGTNTTNLGGSFCCCGGCGGARYGTSRYYSGGGTANEYMGLEKLAS